jgi:type II secretory pathway component HofQ
MKKQILIGLFWLTVFCAAPGFAQEVKPEKKQITEEQYKAFCKPDFVGESMSLNVVNADLRDILNYITEQFGYDFVLDASVGRKVTSVSIDNLPWNIALSNILEPEDLDIQCTERFFRIKVQSKNIVTPETEPEAVPVYTVFIKLSKLPRCAKKAKCVQKTLALNRLKSSVAERLSKKGQVEIDETSQTLIVTDSRGNLNALVKLVETLDNEEFYNQAGKGK